MEVRNLNNINADKLMIEIDQNENPQKIFFLQCPIKVLSTLIEELNKTINKLAPV